MRPPPPFPHVDSSVLLATFLASCIAGFFGKSKSKLTCTENAMRNYSKNKFFVFFSMWKIIEWYSGCFVYNTCSCPLFTCIQNEKSCLQLKLNTYISVPLYFIQLSLICINDLLNLSTNWTLKFYICRKKYKSKYYLP